MYDNLVLIIGIVSIIIQQIKRGDLVKIVSSVIYFVIIYELYIFKNPISSISFLGPIMIYFFYEALEIFDRLFLSWVTYSLVGILLYKTDANKDTYSIFHWLIVRFFLLYIIILPFLDKSVPFIIISIIGLIVAIVKWLSFFEVIYNGSLYE